MTTTTARVGTGLKDGLERAEDWLDARGKWAWIAAMVAGFIVFWPLGAAVLAYTIWGKKMFGRSIRQKTAGFGLGCRRDAQRSSGNSAFDAYKAETLSRLEEEQKAFEGFLKRLREARDKQEFDQFMQDRADKSRDLTVEA